MREGAGCKPGLQTARLHSRLRRRCVCGDFSPLPVLSPGLEEDESAGGRAFRLTMRARLAGTLMWQLQRFL